MTKCLKRVFRAGFSGSKCRKDLDNPPSGQKNKILRDFLKEAIEYE